MGDELLVQGQVAEAVATRQLDGAERQGRERQTGHRAPSGFSDGVHVLPFQCRR